jgi:hypothetical protein
MFVNVFDLKNGIRTLLFSWQISPYLSEVLLRFLMRKKLLWKRKIVHWIFSEILIIFLNTSEIYLLTISNIFRKVYGLEKNKFENTLNQIYDHRSRTVLYLDSFYFAQTIGRSEGKLLDRIIMEKFAWTTPLSLNFPQNHRFYESFNHKIQQMVTAGIIDHFGEDYKDILNLKQFKPTPLDEWEALNLSHFEAGFKYWLFSLIFPIVAFIGEWICRFRDFIVFRCVVETFVDIQIRNMRAHHRKMQILLKKLENKKAKILHNQANKLRQRELNF